MRPGKASRGWGSQAYKNGNKDGVQWKHSQAVRIGWFDGTSLYLDEHETMNLVQTLATQQHNQINQPAPVKNRLVEKGWLLSEHRGRQDPLHDPIPDPT